MKALLNKFYFILENDNSAFKDELQPQIKKQITILEKEIRNS